MEEELTNFDYPCDYPDKSLAELALELIENAYRRLNDPPDNVYCYIATPDQIHFFDERWKEGEK